jgi:hypothetical protein
MWPYWLLFLMPASAAVLLPHRALRGGGYERVPLTLGWLFVTTVLLVAIGLRHEVGGDWANYLPYLDRAEGDTLGEVLAERDPGFQLVNWVSATMGWGIYGVNLLCAVPFVLGLERFCRGLARPWLALAVGVPYLVIVLGMGYTRQGVALGFAMLGLAALQRGKRTRFGAWVMIGASFHGSAMILLPLAALAAARNRWWTITWVSATLLVAWQQRLASMAAAYQDGYLEAGMQSQGALIRVAMNAVPAVLLIVLYRRFALPEVLAPLWRWVALASVGLLGVLAVSSSSTAVDRLALYLLPLQLVVYAHLPDAIGKADRSNQSWVLLVVLGYALVQFVWLTYSIHAMYWLPYRFMPVPGL